MTRADSTDTESAYTQQSFITLFKKAGYSTSWFANQDLSDSYAYFAHECDTLVYCNADFSLYSYDLWLDADMVPVFKTWVAGRNKAPVLAVLHSIGSHWWYKSHYTPEQAVFRPDITHKDVGGLKEEEIINAYDNTIVATDGFISSIINVVEDRNAIVFFISDHGESLGENGKFLHGTEAEPLHRPACFVWLSKKYKQIFPDKADALKEARMNRFTTDAVFHTVLDIAGIKASVLDKRFSMAYHATN